MTSEKLIGRLMKSRQGQELLSAIEASENAEIQWKSSAAELKKLRAVRPELVRKLQANLDAANGEVREAWSTLRTAQEKSSAAARQLDGEIFQVDQRLAKLEATCYRNAPETLLNDLSDLRERLQKNLDTSQIGIPQSTDLRRRKVFHDKTAVQAHLAARKEIEQAIQEVERKILSGSTE